MIAGSIRRRRPEVGDIEILFVSKQKLVTDPGDLFGEKQSTSAADLALDALLRAAVIARRPNKNGAFTWGAENKLAVHIASGIPVDFFATDEERFWNALFVRTGPSALNKLVATRAIERGWNWHAYGDGFTRTNGLRVERKRMKSEHDVFSHLELPYQEPWER